MNDVWQTVVARLTEQKKTITVMESCTGGGLADRITSVPGASEVFREGFVTYSNEAKIRAGVPAEVIGTYGVYSAETASAMAKAALERANADYALAVTGQLGRPDPNNPSDTLNCVWFAIAEKGKPTVVEAIRVSDTDRAAQKKEVIARVAERLLKIL